MYTVIKMKKRFIDEENRIGTPHWIESWIYDVQQRYLFFLFQIPFLRKMYSWNSNHYSTDTAVPLKCLLITFDLGSSMGNEICEEAGCLCLKPVIWATQEADIKKDYSLNPAQANRKILSQIYLTQTWHQWLRAVNLHNQGTEQEDHVLKLVHANSSGDIISK
jgi:hypothetical protein